MRDDLAGGRLIGIRSLLITATVLAVMSLPREQAAPEPLNLNINNLLPRSYREEYQRKISELSKQAQLQAVENEKRLAEEEHQRQLERERVVEAPVRVVQVAQVSGDCYEAMKTTWPQELWASASIVMQRESGAISNKIGPEIRPGVPGYNSDGSQDFGCFQINNFAHAGFFANHNWADPYQNAAYGYQIYLGRHSFSAWYAVKGILF